MHRVGLGAWGVGCVLRLRELNYAEVDEVVLGGGAKRRGVDESCRMPAGVVAAFHCTLLPHFHFLFFSLSFSLGSPFSFSSSFYAVCPPLRPLSHYISDTEHL